MDEKTITLRGDLVEQLEAIASTEGRSVDEVLAALLASQTAPRTQANWAVNLAQAMADEAIPWKEEAELSTHSRDLFQDDRYQRWQETQQTEDHNG
ncbi:MAG: hypothetical protein H6672_20645 [Anaerolineaceae bacterium]|nr:hypothetical protein [Anaerolineaceae bacterium]